MKSIFDQMHAVVNAKYSTSQVQLSDGPAIASCDKIIARDSASRVPAVREAFVRLQQTTFLLGVGEAQGIVFDVLEKGEFENRWKEVAEAINTLVSADTYEKIDSVVDSLKIESKAILFVSLERLAKRNLEQILFN